MNNNVKFKQKNIINIEISVLKKMSFKPLFTNKYFFNNFNVIYNTNIVTNKSRMFINLINY